MSGQKAILSYKTQALLPENPAKRCVAVLSNAHRALSHTIRVLIKSAGGKVNIRTGNGTSYSRITAVAPETTLEYVASAFNGWQAVKIGSQVGWVSGEYSEIVTE